MSTLHKLRPLRYRAIWISDVHLGFHGCQADFLLDFLRSTETEWLYLVGDIIDIWQMKRGLFWPQAHNNVIRTILGKAKHGTKVVYIPGNHDELFRDYVDTSFGNVVIRENAIHTTANGRRLLILHGDEFDAVVKNSRLMALLGTRAYDYLLRLNHIVNLIRRKLGFQYWSLSAYIKHRVKNAVKYISRFEHAVAFAAKQHDADGLVCGHIHRAEITHIDNVLYMNCGDWVESCTALVERHDGEIELLHWADEQCAIKSLSSEVLVMSGAA